MIKNKTIGIELMYKSNELEGLTPFDGEPKPTKEVLALIGDEGINFIKNTMKLFGEVKRKIFGNNHKKALFHEKQYFHIIGTSHTILLTPIGNNSNGDYYLELDKVSICHYKQRKKAIHSLMTTIKPFTSLKKELDKHREDHKNWKKQGFRV